jgi:hypothetical protein
MSICIEVMNMERSQHNYIRKFLELQRQGKIRQGSVYEVYFLHESWCGLHLGGFCNCDCEIIIKR